MRDIGEAELISRALESRILDIHAPMPGIVQAFYAAIPGVSAAAVDVLPVCARGIPTDSDTLENEPFPVIPNVPIVYPRGGGVLISWPLMPGDVVLLVPLMLDATQWRLTGDVVNAPAIDQRTHHIAHCIAIPGLLADVGSPVPNPAAALTLAANGATLTLDGSGTGTATLDAPSIKLGSGAVNAAADASKVDAQLQAIAAASAGWGGSPYTPSGSVAASKVKVE